MTDTWQPEQYNKFRAERLQPALDLIGLLDPVPGGCAIDLGCGTGEATEHLHVALGLGSTLGIDTSRRMLDAARERHVPGLRFVHADMATYTPERPLDVVYSNAALHWLPDHPTHCSRLARMLRPGGQLAVQMPYEHLGLPAVAAAAVAGEEPFRTALGGFVRESPVLEPQVYAQMLDEFGLVELHVRLQVYPQYLESRAGVVEWTKGTLLTDYTSRLPDAMREAFVQRVSERVVPQLPDRRPYFFPYRRLLLRARRPA